MSSETTRTGAERQFSWGEIVLAGGAVAALLLLAWLFLPSLADTDGAAVETVRFIGLLIIFMAALAATAAVFVWLRLGNQQEAFGLPSGSVRALLAVGVMILFVVFGLPLVSPVPENTPKRIAERSLGTSDVAAAQLAETVDFNRKQGLTVIVLDGGRTPSEGDAGAPARIDIREATQARPAEELDFSKQMLTAIVTLLTSVVSFYFGSRTASEVTGQSQTAAGASDDPLTALRKRIGASAAILVGRVRGAAGRVEALKAKEIAHPNTERAKAIAAVQTLSEAADAAYRVIEGHIGSADTALKALQSITDPLQSAQHEQVAKTEMQSAEALIARAEASQADYERQLTNAEAI